MSEEQYKKIFSKNLRHYMNLHDKSQSDLINDLGFNKSAVSTWCNGTRLPRMDKVEILAKYFGISRSDLIEDRCESAAHEDDSASLSAAESQLIDKFRQLNEEGQEQAQDYMEYLVSCGKYKKGDKTDLVEAEA